MSRPRNWVVGGLFSATGAALLALELGGMITAPHEIAIVTFLAGAHFGIAAWEVL